VRQMMTKNSGVPPESLPIADDISGVKRRLKSAEKAMKKMDNNKKKPPKALAQ
jgi:DNA-damage-inducible protein D